MYAVLPDGHEPGIIYMEECKETVMPDRTTIRTDDELDLEFGLPSAPGDTAVLAHEAEVLPPDDARSLPATPIAPSDN